MKKIILGNDYSYLIGDENIKKEIIDILYSKLDLSQFRYIILNSISKLKFLQEHEHYVAPNFKGNNYFLLLLKIKNNNYSIIIDRKKLSYHKNQLDIKNLDIIEIKLTLNDNLYDCTILDGKVINNNNNYLFLIQDCFYLQNIKLIDMELNVKLQYIYSILEKNIQNDILSITPLNSNEVFKSTIFNFNCNNFYFKLNELYNYKNLTDLINNLDKLSINISGIIFFPKFSGINVIHIEKKIEYKKDIIHNYVNFLKSRIYTYENDSNTKILWLTRNIIPDVYDISETDFGDKIDIALIPTLKISHLCDNIITDKPKQFICVYSNKFKKWIPIAPLNN